MIALPEHLEQPFLHIAEIEHKPVMSLIEQALMQFLEDYQDTRLAEQAIKRIESGESELVDWETVRAGLYDVED